MSGERTESANVTALLSTIKSAASPFRRYLQELHAKLAPVMDGAVANYIPELAKADPNWFGISVVTLAGTQYDVGDFKQRFTIQSVSKAFMYGLALEDHGREATLSRVGVEPTGDAFNSIIKLDQDSKRPHNPMVNAGAIATAGLIKGKDSPERINRVMDMFERYTGHRLDVDIAVYSSEKTTGHRNRALSHLMLNFDMIDNRIDEILDLYFQQCSLLIDSHDLAMMAATLANGGVNPISGARALSADYVKDVLSIMYTCGMYDYAGQWAYDVGIPAKSGVGGGICAVVPGVMGIGIFSPLLDVKGNSVRGVKACETMSSELGLHMLGKKNTALLERLLPETVRS